jgi:hypothetical protein
MVMLAKIQKILKKQKGLGVVEMVIIIAVLVALALAFRRQIGGFAGRLFKATFEQENIEQTINADPTNLE